MQKYELTTGAMGGGNESNWGSSLSKFVGSLLGTTSGADWMMSSSFLQISS
jgi:hypothetical protein